MLLSRPFDLLNKKGVEPRMEGTLTLLIGPMFSGKSTELLRRIRRLIAGGKKCLVLVPTQDSRPGEQAQVIETHNKERMDAVKVSCLSQVPAELISECDAIGIDEAQFLLGSLARYVELWIKLGRDVIIAALDRKWNRSPFLPLTELHYDHLVHLTAICHCGKEAAFTHRINTEDENDVLVGGSESYEALCGNCYRAATLVQ